jgi:hypothetical protein
MEDRTDADKIIRESSETINSLTQRIKEFRNFTYGILRKQNIPAEHKSLDKIKANTTKIKVLDKKYEELLRKYNLKEELDPGLKNELQEVINRIILLQNQLVSSYVFFIKDAWSAPNLFPYTKTELNFVNELISKYNKISPSKIDYIEPKKTD